MINQKPNRNLNKWLVFMTMPAQMGITIYLFYKGGVWLDKYYGIHGEWYTKGLGLLGVVVSLYYFIKQVNRLNKNG